MKHKKSNKSDNIIKATNTLEDEYNIFFHHTCKHYANFIYKAVLYSHGDLGIKLYIDVCENCHAYMREHKITEDNFVSHIYDFAEQMIASNKAKRFFKLVKGLNDNLTTGIVREMICTICYMNHEASVEKSLCDKLARLLEPIN